MGNISTKFKKALIQGDETLALAIYKSNVDIQKSLEPCTSLGEHYQHNTPLHYAFKNAMPQFVNIFLRDYPVDLGVRNALGQTALHLLCKHAGRSRCPTHEGTASPLPVEVSGDGRPDPPPDDTEGRIECFEALWGAMLPPTHPTCHIQDGRHFRADPKLDKEIECEADDRKGSDESRGGEEGAALFEARDTDRGWGALHYAAAAGNAPLTRLLVERAGCRVPDRVTPNIRQPPFKNGAVGGFIQNGGGGGRGWAEDEEEVRRRRPVNNALEIASASAILAASPPCCSELVLGYLEFVALFLSDETEVVSCRELSELEVAEPYSTLSRVELQEHKDQLIVETADMLGVPLFTAEGLLRNYEWSRSKLLESWIRDPVTCCRKSGVQSPVRENFLFSTTTPSPGKMCSSADENSPISSELYCGICEQTYDETANGGNGPTFKLAQVRKTRMDCDHSYCHSCWESYLTLKIREGNVHVIMCPAFDCHHLVPVEFIERVVSRDMAKKYLQYDIQAFVESNPAIKWCPHPGCTRAVKFPQPPHPPGPAPPTRQSSSTPPTSIAVDCGAHVTEVTMGHHFCWGCGGCAHAPTPCPWWSQWGARISRMDSEELRCNAEESDAAANRLWLLTNAKACPNCGSPIQKNEGCNHMRCCKCKFDFCWICLDPWKKHSSSTGGYFRCHRYEATQKARERASLRMAEAREKNEKMRELTRFVHHYTKFTDHENRLSAEESTLAQEITNKISKLRSYFTKHQYDLLQCPLLPHVLSPQKLGPYLKLKASRNIPVDQPSSSKDHVTTTDWAESEFLRDLGQSSFDPTFLKSALEQLIKAQMVCRAAVVYAYYLPPDESCYNKTIFEFMQNELEEYTDNLGRMINGPHLICPRLKVIQMTHFLARKRQEFLDVLATGLVPPETPPLLRKFRRKYFPNLMDMDLGENDSKRALGQLFTNSTLPALMVDTPRSYFLAGQAKNQLMRRRHRVNSSKNCRTVETSKPTTTRTRLYNNGIFSVELDPTAPFKVRSGINSERRRCIELDLENPWVKDESGRHSNLVALYDWPPPEASDCSPPDSALPLTEKGGPDQLISAVGREVGLVMEQFGAIDTKSPHSYPPVPTLTTADETEGEKDSSECGRSGCRKKKVRNPRTGVLHNYCSFKCSQLAKIESQERASKPDSNVNSSCIDQNGDEIHMDMLRAFEMSRIQRLKELEEQLILQQQTVSSCPPTPVPQLERGESESQEFQAQTITIIDSEEQQQPRCSENSGAPVSVNTVQVVIMVHPQPEINFSKVLPSRSLTPEASGRSPSPLSGGESADQLLRQLTRTKVPVLELFESLREKALAYSKNLNSPQGGKLQMGDKIADFSVGEERAVTPFPLTDAGLNGVSPIDDPNPNGSNQTLDYIDADSNGQTDPPALPLTPGGGIPFLAPIPKSSRQKIMAAFKPKAPLNGSIYGVFIRNDLSSPRPKSESVN